MSLVLAKLPVNVLLMNCLNFYFNRNSFIMPGLTIRVSAHNCPAVLWTHTLVLVSLSSGSC